MFKDPFARLLRVLLSIALLAVPASAFAEAAEIKVAQQYGIGYLPLMIMEEQKLIEMMFRTANGRLTAAEALGHREFVLTRLYESA